MLADCERPALHELALTYARSSLRGMAGSVLNLTKLMNRRTFLYHAAVSTASLAAIDRFAESAAAQTPRVKWPVGCFNRPWTTWGMDAALDGIKAAGFNLVGLLTRTGADPLNGSEATPEYLDALKGKIAARGLKANLGTVHTRQNLPMDQAVADLHQQIDNGKKLGLEYLMNFGVDQPRDYAIYYKLMAAAAAYAQERGLKVVLKPHGGGSGAAEEILRCVKEVNHPNFSVWYDAGNIIHYTGKDPVAELQPIARYVTGFCAKDCAKMKGEVMIQFGEGKVDFKGVFASLKTAGFNGPIMIEGTDPGQSAAEATVHARANREFLERILASV